ncbi:egl-9 [Symbiodinium sp. CCMP2592]|nr:egl-9 [Symbiodinium sp. CCMP2592]
MLALLAKRRQEVTWALLATVSANLENAQARGYTRKQQVLQMLLAEVKKVLASQQPTPQTVPLPMPPLDASPLWRGDKGASRRLLYAVTTLLETQGYAICDHFASPEDVRLLAEELAAYDKDFETAKIWVGKQASGAQLSVPTVRSDRIFWVCGEHRTPAREMLWDSAGKQPTVGLAPCRPEVVMEKATHGFPRLRSTMNRVDDFVLHGLAKHVGRLAGLAERSDAMVSIYEGGARFQKHVDNPNKDGRVLTSIVYLNSGEPWGADDGGELRMFPEGEPPLDFTPETGRLVLFWADRLPHEVLPAKRRRMALTYWWFDRAEREAKVQELADEVGNQHLKVSEESMAQDFIAFMLSDTSSPAEIVRKAHKLPEKALSTVATVVGASDAQEALEGIGRLKDSDLARLRGSMGKMGLR